MDENQTKPYVSDVSRRLPNRREFTRLAAGTLASLAVAPSVSGSGTATAANPSSSVDDPSADSLRICHMTDWHVCPERRSVEGSARALETAISMDPGLILTGGDLIYDSFATTKKRADQQWVLFKELMAGCSVPIEHCLGNHDLWGWNREKSGATGEESDYGMRKALDELGLESSWRSFDLGGWHFVVLDSVVGDGGAGYLARIADPQREWLQADLSANELPTVVVSHIPLVSVTPLAWQRDYDRGDHGRIDGSVMHLDGRSIHRLLRECGNVKLCLSGHMHMIDRCEIDGITYCNGGAVCGEWWKPSKSYCEPTFAVVDLAADGSFLHRMTETGWVNA